MNFEKILNLLTTHAYFNDERAPGLFTCVPLKQSQATLNNLYLGFKQTPQGFFLFARTNDAERHNYYIVPPANTFLSIGLYPNNPELLNFTEMPYIAPGDEIFYKQLDDPATTVTLTESNLYPLELKGILTYPVEFEVQMLAPSLSCYKKRGKRGGRHRDGYNPLFPDPALFYLDLTTWPDGLYEISIVNPLPGDIGGHNLNFTGKKVFTRRNLIANPPLVILTYVLPEKLERAQLSDASFRMELKAREVYWRYQFEKLSDDKSSYSIKTDDAHFTGTQPDFEAPDFSDEKVDLVTGEITSTNQVLLTQSPWTKIELIKHPHRGVPHPLIENLPNPCVAKIYRDKKKGIHKFYSLIEVKL